jgi:hypothetical protein
MKTDALSFLSRCIVLAFLCAPLPALAASKGAGIILPVAKGMDLLDQCRTTPDSASYWLPEAAQIADLENGFDAAVTAALKARDETFPDSGYNRQYVGIVIGGKRAIYINAFVPEAGTYSIPGASGSAGDFWRNTAIQVCDGGSYYFGAVYDPATKEFSGFVFNRDR